LFILPVIKDTSLKSTGVNSHILAKSWVMIFCPVPIAQSFPLDDAAINVVNAVLEGTQQMMSTA